MLLHAWGREVLCVYSNGIDQQMYLNNEWADEGMSGRMRDEWAG